MKILVIQQQMIGDVLISTILCNNLRTIYPHAQIDYMIFEHTLPVVLHNPNIDNFILYNKGIPLKSIIKKIRSTKYHLILDAYAKIGTSLMCLFSGAGKTIGFRKWYTSFCYSKTLKRNTKATTKAGLAIEVRIALLQLVEPISNPDLIPHIFLTEEEKELAKTTLQTHNLLEHKLIMISLLGSNTLKSYPAKYMAQVLDFVAANCNGKLLVNYVPSQKQAADEIFSLCNPDTLQKIVRDVQPADLRSFLAILYYCKALIGNEGGAVNMAKAMDIPTFSIFSPSVEQENWDIFADGKKHVSTHLKHYNEAPFINVDRKKNRKQTPALYNTFTPDLFINKLRYFIKENKLE